MKVKPVHSVGDIVFLRTDPEQSMRMVTGIVMRQVQCTYLLTCTDYPETEHYEYEITTTRDMVTLLGLNEKETDE
jgi:hypothetical protein